jgi:hypothetical protein
VGFDPQAFVRTYVTNTGGVEVDTAPDGVRTAIAKLSYDDYNRLAQSHEFLPYELPELPAETRQARIQFNDYPEPGPIGNTTGIIVPKTEIDPAPPNTQPETEQESMWEEFKRGIKKGALYYKKNISSSLHDLAGEAMDKGGTIAMAGGAIATVGGVVAATTGVETVGVGAAVGGVIAQVGGEIAAVGGVVAGVGAGTESAATVLDKAADWIITGQQPDLVQPALKLGESLLAGLILRKLERLKELLDKKTKSNLDGAGNDGGYVVGTGGPCIVGPYQLIKDKCGPGQQAHHIIPDSLLRTTNRKQGMTGVGRLFDSSFWMGPCICLQGQARTQGSEHNTAHKADQDIRNEAYKPGNENLGTLPFNLAADISIKSAIVTKPQCAAQIKAAVDQAYPGHKDDERPVNGSGKPPTGEAKDHLERSSNGNSGRTDKVGGRRKR